MLARPNPDCASGRLTKTIAAAMGWYVEYPHIDGRFIQVFCTLPGLTSGLGVPELAETDDE